MTGLRDAILAGERLTIAAATKSQLEDAQLVTAELKTLRREAIRHAEGLMRSLITFADNEPLLWRIFLVQNKALVAELSQHLTGDTP